MRRDELRGDFMDISLISQWILSIILVYAIFVALLYMMQRQVVFVPDTSVPEPAQGMIPDEKILVITEDKIALKGWWYAPRDEAQPVIVMFHGNAGHIGNRQFKIQKFIDAGYGVLLAEYRGYGGNSGSPSESGFVRDAEAYMDFVLRKQNISERRIILFGESLGSGVAVHIAQGLEVAGVVLEVPFSSLLDVAQARFWFMPFVKWLMHDQFRNDKKIVTVKSPILIGVAGKDEVVPPHFGKALFELAPEPKALRVYDDASHMDLFYYGFDEEIMQFIQENVPVQTP